VKGGGSLSSPLFYTNPQVYFHFDKSKVANPALIEKVETLITYKSDSEADVKLFLVHADTKDRLCSISESKLVDPVLISVRSLMTLLSSYNNISCL
jgi:hypothetical protein